MRAVRCCVNTPRRLHGNRHCLQANPFEQNYSVPQSAQREEDHHELHHVELDGAGEENISSHFSGRACDGCGFLRARLQSFVLVLELLDKMDGLLFAVLKGWDEF